MTDVHLFRFGPMRASRTPNWRRVYFRWGDSFCLIYANIRPGPRND